MLLLLLLGPASLSLLPPLSSELSWMKDTLGASWKETLLRLLQERDLQAKGVS